MCPQAWEMSRGAPGRLYRSPASPDRALPPGWPRSPSRKRAEHPASKTLGTATIPCHRSLPSSARFADEHPIQSGAPGAPLSLTPCGLTAFLRSHPCRAEEEATVPRGAPEASGIRLLARFQDRSLGLALPPRARSDGLAVRFPRQQPSGGSGRRTRAPCRSTSSELMRHAIPVSLTIEPKLSRW
jgi:hypothetical protein